MTDEATGWDLAAARARVRQLEAAALETGRDLQRALGDLTTALYTVQLSKERGDRLQRELDASQRREAVLVAELRECKRAGGAGHTTLGTVTPLRPKPRGDR